MFSLKRNHLYYLRQSKISMAPILKIFEGLFLAKKSGKQLALCFIVGEYNCAAWELNFDYFFVLKPKFSKWARRNFQKVQQATRNKMEIDWSSNYNPNIIILFLTKNSWRKKSIKVVVSKETFLCQFRQFRRISSFSVNID